MQIGLVFEEKKVSLSQLKKALEVNHEGYEDVRQMLLNTSKFGNDEEEIIVRTRHKEMV